MKQNAMWVKLSRTLALALVIMLAMAGAALATAPEEPVSTIPAVLGDDLLNTEEAPQEGDAAPAADIAPVRPLLGIKVANMTTTNYVVVKGILPIGAYITFVQADSPAANAGLLAGDIVVEADETAITGIAQLSAILQAKEAGDTIALKVFRVEGLESAQTYSEIGEGEYLDFDIELALAVEVQL